MQKLKLGLIGLGGISQLIHLPVLKKFKDVEISAVAEINKSRLETVANKFNVKNRFQDYKEMLDTAELDAVIIATPTNSHKQVSIDCLKAGKHIFVEKPIARRYDEAVAIHEEAKKNKRNVMVGMNHRFRPDAMLLKSLIKNGELGDLYFLKTSWAREQSSREKWMLKKDESGGGVILDLGIVLLDLALWFYDYRDIYSVSAQHYFKTTKEVEDTAVAFIRCKDTSVIGLEVSWLPKPVKENMILSLYGSKGYAQFNPLKAFKRINNQFIDFSPSGIKDEKHLYTKSYENELRYFISAVRGDYPFMSTSSEAVYRMSIIESIYKSAETKAEIKL